MVRKGALRAVRIGRRMRFRLQDVEAFEEAGGTAAGGEGRKRDRRLDGGRALWEETYLPALSRSRRHMSTNGRPNSSSP